MERWTIKIRSYLNSNYIKIVIFKAPKSNFLLDTIRRIACNQSQTIFIINTLYQEKNIRL